MAAARCEQLEGLALEEVTKCRNVCDRAIEQQAALEARRKADEERQRAQKHQTEAEGRAADAAGQAAARAADAAERSAQAASAKKRAEDIAGCEATCAKQNKPATVCKRVCAQ